MSWREELAWAAGFFDGEGYIGFRPQSRTVRITVNQCDPAPLERFRSAVLGVGKVSGPRPQPKPNHRDQWDFEAGRFEHVQAIVAMLWPFLCHVKKKQAKEAFKQLHASRSEGGWRYMQWRRKKDLLQPQEHKAA